MPHVVLGLIDGVTEVLFMLHDEDNVASVLVGTFVRNITCDMNLMHGLLVFSLDAKEPFMRMRSNDRDLVVLKIPKCIFCIF